VKPRSRRTKGLFITLEGPEGSGKSTQSVRLTAALRQAGYSVVRTREPGGTPLAEAIRHTLLSTSSRESVTAETEALLILAARSHHVAHIIMPALQRGQIVICDRFSDSTFAYQGYGRDVNMQWLRKANDVASGGLSPVLTLLFDLPASVGLARRRKAQGGQNRLDRESENFHRKVRRGFLALARQAPRRITVIDATQRPDDIAMVAQALVFKRLPRYRLVRGRKS
jgi:dTMP kinase